MIYRKLPHGEEKLSCLGLGMGGIQSAPPEETEKTVRKGIENGINFFDLCAGVYNKQGEYGWSRDLSRIKETFEWEMSVIKTDYADFGFLHCVDEENDIKDIEQNGILDYVKDLKRRGIVRHMGFSSHTPEVAQRLIDTGLMDMMMFSVNPAYDMEKGDEYGIGSAQERAALFRRCQAEGIGISVMKPFHGGQLLAKNTSPFGEALTINQCLQYALDRPAVLSAVPGVRGLHDLDELLSFLQASAEERDYSVIGSFTPKDTKGTCVYCKHCHPCPAGLDIGLINKYYDLSRLGDVLAKEHYLTLEKTASDCLQCGHCNSRCPFSVDQMARMEEIQKYFGR